MRYVHEYEKFPVSNHFILSPTSDPHSSSFLSSMFVCCDRCQRVAFIKMILLVDSKQQLMQMERDAATVTKDDLQATIASSGHDMKSPITSLMLAIESVVSTLQDDMASKKGQELSSHRQAVGTCMDAFGTIMHLNMIVNRSVDYCNILATISLTPTLRPVHLKDCIEQVIKVCAATSSMSVRLTGISANVPVHVLTDAFWLQVSVRVSANVSPSAPEQ